MLFLLGFVLGALVGWFVTVVLVRGALLSQLTELTDIFRDAVAATKLVADADREKLQRVLTVVDALTIAVDTSGATGDRLELAAGIARQLAEGVAENLKEGYRLANAADGTVPGMAADAAVKHGVSA